MPSARSASSIASVPEATPTASRAPQNAANARSNASTRGPPTKRSPSRTSRDAPRRARRAVRRAGGGGRGTGSSPVAPVPLAVLAVEVERRGKALLEADLGRPAERLAELAVVGVVVADVDREALRSGTARRGSDPSPRGGRRARPSPRGSRCPSRADVEHLAERGRRDVTARQSARTTSST